MHFKAKITHSKCACFRLTGDLKLFVDFSGHYRYILSLWWWALNRTIYTNWWMSFEIKMFQVPIRYETGLKKPVKFAYCSCIVADSDWTLHWFRNWDTFHEGSSILIFHSLLKSFAWWSQGPVNCSQGSPVRLAAVDPGPMDWPPAAASSPIESERPSASFLGYSCSYILRQLRSTAQMTTRYSAQSRAKTVWSSGFIHSTYHSIKDNDSFKSIKNIFARKQRKSDPP